MSLEEFKKIDATELPIGKLISIIAKNQSLYLNHNLDEFGINASQLHFLFEISHQKVSFKRGFVIFQFRKAFLFILSEQCSDLHI